MLYRTSPKPAGLSGAAAAREVLVPFVGVWCVGAEGTQSRVVFFESSALPRIFPMAGSTAEVACALAAPTARSPLQASTGMGGEAPQGAALEGTGAALAG
eukprot:15467712-Alexandrium_andersonii.AAC.1